MINAQKVLPENEKMAKSRFILTLLCWKKKSWVTTQTQNVKEVCAQTVKASAAFLLCHAQPAAHSIDFHMSYVNDIWILLCLG